MMAQPRPWLDRLIEVQNELEESQKSNLSSTQLEREQRIEVRRKDVQKYYKTFVTRESTEKSCKEL